jgi:superfamily II RNA helicase
VGTVIITAWGDTIPESGELVEMILGKATKLQSQFRLSYNMILNLLRVEEFKVSLTLSPPSLLAPHASYLVPSNQSTGRRYAKKKFHGNRIAD